MKILIDIGHPAHIHYFKNCARILSENGYEFLFVVRERDSTIELIQSTGFKYISRGKGKKGLFGKLMGIPQIDFKLYRIARKFNPDMFLSFSSPYAAHVATLMRKPHIALDDTEHAKFEHWMCRPFTDVVLSPSCYNARLWKNQILFDSFLELCYLSPHYFQPDNKVLERIGVNDGEKYCVIRLVSWDANHDVGQHGLNYNEKLQLVQELSKDCHVFISSEEELDESLQKYRLVIHPKDLHSILYYANFYIGEGGTTASESVVLGTPAIYTNTLNAGLFDEEQDRGLLFHVSKIDEILGIAQMALYDRAFCQAIEGRWKKMLNEKIDPTAFLVWFIKNYPDSKQVMKNNPKYQYRFK